MKLLLRTVVLSALLFSLAPTALAQDGFRATFGVKAWVHTWNTWVGASGAGMEQVESDLETVLVPSLTLRFRNFFVAADLFPEKEYEFLNNAFSGAKIKRREWSVVGGYYVVPQLALALGYKQMQQDTFDLTIDVPMFGLQAGAPIGESGTWFIYGNGFLGPINVSEKSTGDTTDYSGWYYSNEIGLGFRIAERFSATLGYKYQTVRWDDLNRDAPAYDLTAGWIIGLSFTF